MKKYHNSKHCSRIITICTVLLGLCLFGQTAFAQNATTAPERGFNSGKSYSISDIETIAQQSGNMMLNLPLGALPAGRGGMSAGIGLHYNSKLWDMLTVDDDYETNGTHTPYVKNTLIQSEEGGWHYNYQYYLKFDNRRIGPTTAGCSTTDLTYLTKIQLVLPDGSAHTLSVGSGGGTNEDGFSNILPDGVSNCGTPTAVTSGQTLVFYSTDSTYLRLEVTTDSDIDWQNNQWTLYLPNGSRVFHNPASGISQRMTDRNGNYIDIIETAADSDYSGHKTTRLLDQLGRKVVIEYTADTNTTSWTEDWIHSKGVGNTDVVTRVRWKFIGIDKTFIACEYNPPGNPVNNLNFPLHRSAKVVDKIYLPSQIAGSLYYEFSYNTNTTAASGAGWGELNQVKLPSDATSSYEYKNDTWTGTNSIPAEDVIQNRPVKKTLAYNKEYDGSSTAASEIWTYTVTGIDPITSVKVTGPDGGETTEYYTAGTGGSSTAPPEFDEGETYKTISADGTIIEKFYKSNMPTSTAYKANRFVKYEFVTPKDAAGNYPKTVIKEYSYDKNGNLTEVKEYDYINISTNPIQRNSVGYAIGLPSGATPARITKTEYYNDTPDSASTTYTDTDAYYLSTSKRLLNLAKSSEVQDGSNNPQTRSELTYDYTDYSSSNTKGGNLTTTKNFDSFKGGSSQSYSSTLSSTNSITTSATYDIYGNPTQTTDARNVQTTLIYGSITTPSGTVTGLYPTQTEAASNYSGVKRTSTAVYDFSTGVTTSVTDVDNGVTSATEYDALGRPVKTAAAVGTSLEVWTQTVYDDQYRKVIVRSDLETKGDAKKVATQFYDQLGRVRLVKTLEDSSTQSATNETDGIKVQKRYAPSGTCTYDSSKTCSFQLTSNPYRADYSSNATSEESMGWTRSQTVNTGKHSETESFSGVTLPAPWGSSSSSTGKVKTDLDGDRTLVTDQAGKQRISKSNALGQLTDIWEVMATSDASTVSVTFPSQSIAYGYHTSYSYDTLNNLTQVSQGSQTPRSFSYSSLSRLLTAANPESGTIHYNYDDNGNLSSKTDARSVQTTYTYDELNRVLTRSYSNEPSGQTATPTVTYTYDGVTHAKGKLTKVTTGSTSSPFSVTDYQSFDLLGRVTQSQQTTDGTAYTAMTYKYNLSGALIEETYPSTRVVRNVLDNNGDLSIVQSKKNSNYGYWNYAQNFTYTAAGAVSSMQLGNFKWESTIFNSRLQPTQIALGTTKTDPGTTDPGSDLLKLTYDYGTTDNNGNIQTQTIKVPTVGSNPGFTAAQNYTYDSLNRIHDAAETISSTQTWKQTFTYDRFGNRNFDEANTTANLVSFPKNCSSAMCSADKKIYNPAIDVSNNQLSTSDGYTFDNSGNTTKDVTKDSSGNTIYRQFTYDAENKQTKVETVNSSGTVTGTLGEYFYDGDGKRVKKVSTTETTIFLYDASGKMVAEYSTILATTPEVNYLTSDNLGTPRINTDENGKVTARHDYQPFGEEVATSQRNTGLGYNVDDVRKKFTAYERDDESGLDFAEARMYKKELGRFTNPDPLLNSGRPTNPKTWNRYSYVLNNPLNMIDPSGLYDCKGTTVQCETFQRGLDAAQLKANEIKNSKRYGANSQEYLDAQRAIDGYKGAGVTVVFGTLVTGTLGKVTGGINDEGNKSITLTIDLDQNKDSNTLLLTVAHEGSHIADHAEYQDALIAAGNITDPDKAAAAGIAALKLNITQGASETRAYGVTAAMAEFTITTAPLIDMSTSSRVEKVNESRSDSAINLGGQKLWNPSWANTDVAKLRTNRTEIIAKGLKNDPRYGASKMALTIEKSY